VKERSPVPRSFRTQQSRLRAIFGSVCFLLERVDVLLAQREPLGELVSDHLSSSRRLWPVPG
jgi:hypothetical protein